MHSERKEISLPATLESIPQAIGFLKLNLEELGYSRRAQTKLIVIVDEIFSNIAKFAYGHSPGDVTIGILAEQDDPAVEITFIDEGTAFNPLINAPQTDIKSPAAIRRIGGRGIHIVQNLADEIEYECKDAKNILRIRKHIER